MVIIIAFYRLQKLIIVFSDYPEAMISYIFRIIMTNLLCSDTKLVVLFTISFAI